MSSREVVFLYQQSLDAVPPDVAQNFAGLSESLAAKLLVVFGLQRQDGEVLKVAGYEFDGSETFF